MNFAKVISNSDHLPVVGSHQCIDIGPVGSFWPDAFDWKHRCRKISLKYNCGATWVYFRILFTFICVQT